MNDVLPLHLRRAMDGKLNLFHETDRGIAVASNN